MADIPTLWIAGSGAADWPARLADLPAGSTDLATAVLLSVFTDATATPDETPSGSDPRGWWGDATIGSRLWMRARAKQTDALLAIVRSDIADALQWLIDDGVASSIDVSTEWTRPGVLGALITVHRGTGGPVALRFDRIWEGL